MAGDRRGPVAAPWLSRPTVVRLWRCEWAARWGRWDGGRGAPAPSPARRLGSGGARAAAAPHGSASVGDARGRAAAGSRSHWTDPRRALRGGLSCAFEGSERFVRAASRLSAALSFASRRRIDVLIATASSGSSPRMRAAAVAERPQAVQRAVDRSMRLRIAAFSGLNGLERSESRPRCCGARSRSVKRCAYGSLSSATKPRTRGPANPPPRVSCDPRWAACRDSAECSRPPSIHRVRSRYAKPRL